MQAKRASFLSPIIIIALNALFIADLLVWPLATAWWVVVILNLPSIVAIFYLGASEK
jgi:hypothetical protein